MKIRQVMLSTPECGHQRLVERINKNHCQLSLVKIAYLYLFEYYRNNKIGPVFAFYLGLVVQRLMNYRLSVRMARSKYYYPSKLRSRLMKFNRKLLSLATAIVLGSAAATAQAVTTLDFADNTSPAAAPLPYSNTTGVYVGGTYISTAAPNTNAFSAGNEFRMIGGDGLVGGGGEKTIVDGNQSWDIADNGVITTTGTDLTPTTNSDGLWQGADFFGSQFGFVNAPTSLTLDASSITANWADGLTAEWGGSFFPMGSCDAANQVHTDGQGCGITLSGDVMNMVTNPDGSQTFDFSLFGEHRITTWEDTEGGTASSGNGFAGWNAEWELHGTGSVSAIPVPAAVWLFGSGLMGLVGVARRKKSA
jgi:hypothetical protein